MKTKTKQKEKAGKYSIIPAAYSYLKFGGVGLYVRYAHTKAKSVRVKEKKSDYIWLETPDRELLIVSNLNKELPFYPTEGSFDEFVPISLFHPTANDFEFDFCMVNFTEHAIEKGPRRNPGLRLDRETSHIQIMSDSGGFQLRTGAADYINPIELAEWCNDNVNMTMALDIPVLYNDRDLLKRSAKVQTRNNEIMLEHALPEMELINIVHGASWAERKEFLTWVDNEKIDRLAMGSGLDLGVLANTIGLMDLIVTSRPFKHYHILGVSNALRIIPLMRAAHYGLAPLITSDSTTYIMRATARMFLNFETFISKHTTTPIGTQLASRNVNNRSNVHSLLPCSCAVCSRIRYMDVFSLFGGPVHALLSTHNMIKFNSYLQAMYDHMHLPFNELKEILVAQHKGHLDLDECLRSVQFIDEIMNTNIKKAVEKFSRYKARSRYDQFSSNKHFAKNNSLWGGEYVGQQIEKPSAKQLDRLKHVLKLYEDPKSLKKTTTIRKGK